MVEAIWPLSGNACNQTNGRGILPLRRYIEETLRRSRTSYSTLQVALYYLILIKSHVPKHDFTMIQPADCAMLRSMQCGRRMFLAALILASKYLQDRNYSAKAWSKMSGLRTSEINSNERMFLQAVNWELHITDGVFKRWTDVVLRFTAPSFPPSAGQSMAVDHKSIWAQAMPFLTPELDNPKVSADDYESEVDSPVSVECAASAVASTVAPTGTAFGLSPSQASAPSLSSSLPRFLEPKAEVSPPTPALARLGPLPTPQMTPSSVASNTPAASVCSSRRPSMSSAMSQAQNNAFYRLTIDRFPSQVLSRSVSGSSAPSLMSSGSSPTSIDSDCSRSRSSSFGSASATSTSAPGQAGLARLATCHVGGQNMNGVSSLIEGTKECPIRIIDDADMSASPEISLVSMDGTCVKQLPQLTSSLSCRKRTRSGEDIQARVRSMLQDHDAPRSGFVAADEMVVGSQISPNAMRRVWQTLSRPDICVSVKGSQSLSAIHADSERVPICRDSGRKRTCAYVDAQRS